MTAEITRRGLLAGGAALLAASRGAAQTSALPAAEILAAAQLSGDIGFAVADLRSGQVLEAQNPALGLAPASTMKALTTAYAFAHLGTNFRFATRVATTGPVRGGKVQGDLLLLGGGDPTLTTDGLLELARRVAAAGITGCTGRFRVWGGALPYRAEIAEGQPVHVGYNPAISGLILNYNRVHFEWRRGQGGWQLGMDARTDRIQPPAYTFTAALSARDSPVYSYTQAGGKEAWTVSAAALGRGGSRWLPVRRPELYAGDVFQTVARGQGLDLPPPEPMTEAPRGEVIAELPSAELREIVVDMLRHSTNITAEAVGLTTSLRRGVGGASGAAMAQWLRETAGVRDARLEDHSGLGAGSRIGALDMVRALAVHGPRLGLRGVMKPFAMRDAAGRVLKASPVRVEAKTGTLNFVSTLAGYMTARDGTELVFAILTGDLAQRARFAAQEEAPGSGEWVRRSKILQSRLIERWAALYGQ